MPKGCKGLFFPLSLKAATDDARSDPFEGGEFLQMNTTTPSSGLGGGVGRLGAAGTHPCLAVTVAIFSAVCGLCRSVIVSAAAATVFFNPLLLNLCRLSPPCRSLSSLYPPQHKPVDCCTSFVCLKSSLSPALFKQSVLYTKPTDELPEQERNLTVFGASAPYSTRQQEHGAG